MHILEKLTTLSEQQQMLLMFAAMAIAAILGWVYRWYQERNTLGSAGYRRDQILENARRESDVIKREALLEARDEFQKERINAQKDLDRQRSEQKRIEDKIRQKEEALDKKLEAVEKTEVELKTGLAKLSVDQKNLLVREQELRKKLEQLSRLTSDEAKSLLIKEIEDEARAEAARLVRKIEEEAKHDSDEKAQEILTIAMQRYASDITSERTVSTISLPNDDLKGRIIGREGRNIREFERLSGVDLVIDDTPQAVHLSCFDPVRREIAKIALTKLVADGRIHPTRIEEVLEKAKKEVDQLIRKAADEVTYELGIHNIRPELLQILGRLKYRMSYGQNVLMHSKEVAHLGALIAAEMGYDVALIRRACLLHDIGKAVDHEVEGPHALVGAEVLKRYNESPVIVAAVAGHHGDAELTIEAIMVQIADAISASRPGVRVERADMYVKRLEALEKIALTFKGVEKAYAVQAGREVRVLVNHQQVTDHEARQNAKDIAKKIETDLDYPGQIRVTVIRETKFVDYAR